MKRLYLLLVLVSVAPVAAQTDACRADFDSSGVVDFQDFLRFGQAFGMKADGCEEGNKTDDLEALLRIRRPVLCNRGGRKTVADYFFCLTKKDLGVNIVDDPNCIIYNRYRDDPRYAIEYYIQELGASLSRWRATERSYYGWKRHEGPILGLKKALENLGNPRVHGNFASAMSHGAFSGCDTDTGKEVLAFLECYAKYPVLVVDHGNQVITRKPMPDDSHCKKYVDETTSYNGNAPEHSGFWKYPESVRRPDLLYLIGALPIINAYHHAGEPYPYRPGENYPYPWTDRAMDAVKESLGCQ